MFSFALSGKSRSPLLYSQVSFAVHLFGWIPLINQELAARGRRHTQEIAQTGGLNLSSLAMVLDAGIVIQKEFIL